MFVEKTVIMDVSAVFDDERLFDKKTLVFSKVWGMNPSNGVSMNALTENDKDYKHDPLYNGISLDLINETSGDITGEMSFGKHSLFKLENFQAPILLNQIVTKDANFELLSLEDYEDMKRLHQEHSTSSYSMAIYEDELYDALTFPNYKFSRQPGGLDMSGGHSIGMRRTDLLFKTDAFKTPWWLSRADQRVMFQVSPKLLTSTTAYDSIAFHQGSRCHSLDLLVEGGKNETNFSSRGDIPLVPMARIYLCVMETGNGSHYRKLLKTEFEHKVRVKQLSRDITEEFKIVDSVKLFNFNVMWCVDFGEIKRLYTGDKWDEDLRAMYNIVYDTKTNEITCKYEFELADLFALSVPRFYTRYSDKALSTDIYNAQLNAHSQFSTALFKQFKYNSGISNDGSAVITCEQYNHCKRDTDTITAAPIVSSLRIKPKHRADRCLSAYNKTTKELVIQFMPILEDRYPFKPSLDSTTTPTESTTNAEDFKQRWFYRKLLELNTFLGQDSNMLPGCKRHIFSVFVEHNVLGDQNAK